MAIVQKILVVDDEPASVRLIKRLLKNQYELGSASSGEEAIEIISSFKPDLVLLDINMTGIDGYETCRRIRTNEEFKLIKILLITGRGELDERLRGYESGADDYIAKPFSAAELKAKIDVFMKLKRSEEIEKVKSDLLTLFSHETRTPLSAIIGLAELLEDNKELDDQTRNCARLICRSATDLHAFIEKTLLLLRLKSGIELHKERGSLRQHLEKITKETEEAARHKNLSLRKELSHSGEIEADWIMLEKVFVYILDNAVKFSPKGGGEITTRVQSENGLCTVEVRDQGQGIDPAWIDKIFDEFAIQDVAHHQQGQGLSMAIAKHIVELHGGTIEVESTHGEGTLFSVNLPLV